MNSVTQSLLGIKDKIIADFTNLLKVDRYRNFFKDRVLKGDIKAIIKLLLILYGTHAVLHFILKTKGLLPKKNVRGQHVFITGAGSGIGKRMAEYFAGAGARVTLVDINLEAVQNVESQLTQKKQDAFAVQCNVADRESVKEAANQARNRFGDVDILINNAGIVSGKKVLENTETAMERTVQVNTISHFYTVKQFLPAMINKNHGHVVTIASSAGLTGVAGLLDYCASKYGAIGVHESLYHELRLLKSKVKTTCICSYYINTGMFEGVKTRFPLLLPIMSEKYATQRIINAILQEEEQTILPTLCHFLLFKNVLPNWLVNFAFDLFGISKSMEEFVGRK